jgi:hypothetical protein
MNDAERTHIPPEDIAQPIIDILARDRGEEIQSSDFSANIKGRHGKVSKYILGQLVELGVPEAEVLLTETEEERQTRTELLHELDKRNYGFGNPSITEPSNINELRRIKQMEFLVGATSILAVSWAGTKGKTNWYARPLQVLERFERQDEYPAAADYMHSLIYRMKDGDPPSDA